MITLDEGTRKVGLPWDDAKDSVQRNIYPSTYILVDLGQMPNLGQGKVAASYNEIVELGCPAALITRDDTRRTWRDIDFVADRIRND